MICPVRLTAGLNKLKKNMPKKVFLEPLKGKVYLITVQQDATQSSLFIILQVHSTCFGCQPHPSSGVHKTVTAASGYGQRGQLGHVGGR